MWQEATSPCKEVAAATKMEANIPFFFFFVFLHPKEYRSVGSLCAKIQGMALCDPGGSTLNEWGRFSVYHSGAHLTDLPCDLNV
jgi:hypothetical protein